MKKTLLVMVAVILLASVSFADVSFMTAPGIGQGKWALLGVYATNHIGAIANEPALSANDFDSTSVGLKATYGVMENMDLMVAYSADTLVNMAGLGNEAGLGLTSARQTSGSTTGLGLKYTVAKASAMFPVDSAVMIGYQSSALGLSTNLGKTSMGQTEMAIAGIFSRMIGICVPYGGIALKSLSKDLGKVVGGTKVDADSGTGLMFNLGVYIGIAQNQAVAIEYNTETDVWAAVTKSGHAIADKDNYALSVSGISLGYVYMF